MGCWLEQCWGLNTFHPGTCPPPRSPLGGGLLSACCRCKLYSRSTSRNASRRLSVIPLFGTAYHHTNHCHLVPDITVPLL